MQGNYDPVAGFYDALSGAVFANRIFHAQLFLLHAIPPEARVLIVGGGTGWILEEIARRQGAGLSITYVEISAGMLALSKRRYAGTNAVDFIHGPIQEIQLENFYDIIITPFLFDNFSDETLKWVFDKLDHHLHKGGYWLFSDFQLQKNKLSQKLLIKIMYLFFRITCKVEASRLPDAGRLFYQYGYTNISQKTFFKGFICSVIYQK
jgi:ubiquinone/menaquinone biosynthesis C-methylase UbiE